MDYEIEDGDTVRLKNERFCMNVKRIDNEMALCSFYDSIEKKNGEEWIKVIDLILVEKKTSSELKIEAGDIVHLKSEKFTMEVKERENEKALCCFYNTVNREDKEEWIRIDELNLVKKVNGGFRAAGQTS